MDTFKIQSHGEGWRGWVFYIKFCKKQSHFLRRHQGKPGITNDNLSYVLLYDIAYIWIILLVLHAYSVFLSLACQLPEEETPSYLPHT